MQGWRPETSANTQLEMIQYNQKQYDDIRCGTVQYATIHVQYDTVRWETIHYDMVRYNMTRYVSTPDNAMIQYDTIRHGNLIYNVIRYRKQSWLIIQHVFVSHGLSVHLAECAGTLYKSSSVCFCADSRLHRPFNIPEQTYKYTTT